MEDAQIVALFWERDEAAIREAEEKYFIRIARVSFFPTSVWIL